MSDLLSVIIPCYNPHIDVFAETLQALTASTFVDFQLILVDDGSQDKSYIQICKAYFPLANIILHETNRGLSAARNTGVAHCQTTFFLQQDADDTISPTFLEKSVNALAQHSEWSFCNAWVQGIGERHYFWTKGFDQGPEFLLSNQVTSTAIIRRDVDQAIGGHDESIRNGNEDWDYWLRMAINGYWGGTIPEYLIQYRHHTTPTFWPNRDDPVQKARFILYLWWRYRALFPWGFRGKLPLQQNGNQLEWGKKQSADFLKLIPYLIVKAIFLFGLASGMNWLYSLRENLRRR